jgi:arginase
VAWTRALARRRQDGVARGLPVFMGGDHALSLGTVAGVAAHADAIGPPPVRAVARCPFRHPHAGYDHLGNLHGTPVAYFAGRPGSTPSRPSPPVPDRNVCLYGMRSVDPEEHAVLEQTDMMVCDMRVLDEKASAAPLRRLPGCRRGRGGMLHVSLDVDFLDPEVAPAVGTTVPGGATFREAHLVMECWRQRAWSPRSTSWNSTPSWTIAAARRLMVDLTASLMGRRVFDRPTARLGRLTMSAPATRRPTRRWSPSSASPA